MSDVKLNFTVDLGHFLALEAQLIIPVLYSVKIAPGGSGYARLHGARSVKTRRLLLVHGRLVLVGLHAVQTAAGA